jgi:hypothetical protein
MKFLRIINGYKGFIFVVLLIVAYVSFKFYKKHRFEVAAKNFGVAMNAWRCKEGIPPIDSNMKYEGLGEDYDKAFFYVNDKYDSTTRHLHYQKVVRGYSLDKNASFYENDIYFDIINDSIATELLFAEEWVSPEKYIKRCHVFRTLYKYAIDKNSKLPGGLLSPGHEHLMDITDQKQVDSLLKTVCPECCSKEEQ